MILRVEQETYPIGVSSVFTKEYPTAETTDSYRVVIFPTLNVPGARCANARILEMNDGKQLGPPADLCRPGGSDPTRQRDVSYEPSTAVDVRQCDQLQAGEIAARRKRLGRQSQATDGFIFGVNSTLPDLFLAVRLGRMGFASTRLVQGPLWLTMISINSAG
ncbi:hypothetical protein POX_f08522 [Penicillium oxalicum]|uniref:hypothetical protein n=1 Tax=Penicillium oxalicum TaxID=69781 RepID=UPI0020B7BB5A|nr:hypothetical protein POX_f08522 [Penicillium oxalicum]KAI2788135.1 hypothetical protein POX_f08522 [Penicillium oxalicum]